MPLHRSPPRTSVPPAAPPAAPASPPEFLLNQELPRDHFPTSGGQPHAIHQAIAEELLRSGGTHLWD